MTTLGRTLSPDHTSKHNTLNHVGLMLGHRLRRWPNIKPTLLQCVVFAGKLILYIWRSPPPCVNKQTGIILK